VKAYNDWMVEEWCGLRPGPPHPLCLIPLWDVELAAAEVRRNATVVSGLSASARFLPSSACLGARSRPLLDPFFRACEETKTVINMHIGSSSKMPSTSADAPPRWARP